MKKRNFSNKEKPSKKTFILLITVVRILVYTKPPFLTGSVL